eukprot:692844-Hanusia_phi.AAC.5
MKDDKGRKLRLTESVEKFILVQLMDEDDVDESCCQRMAQPDCTTRNMQPSSSIRSTTRRWIGQTHPESEEASFELLPPPTLEWI